MDMDRFGELSRTQIGLVGSLFMTLENDPDRVMLNTLEEYLDRYRLRLQTFHEDDTGGARVFGDKERAYPRRRLSRAHSDSVFVDATGSNDLKHASAWQIRATFEPDGRYRSGIEWSMAPSTDPREAVEFFLRATRSGRYLHGNAGYGIVLPVDQVAMQMERSKVVALASRFAGLDVSDISGIAIWAGDGIKCVNWLTVVDDVLLDRLGGRDVVRARFSAAILCHDAPHGLVIQAGEVPVLGDANRVDELSHYREVAAVLRPIYSLKLEGVYALRDDRHDVGAAWRNRFFEGARWP